MRVRVSSETYIKLYYTSNENSAFAEGDAKGDKTLLTGSRVPADKKWHIITITPTSNAWVKNPNRVLNQLKFQAANRPGLYEIDWIRFMGNGAVKAANVNGLGTIIKYDNSTKIASAKDNTSVNPGVVYDSESKSIKCKGIVWSRNCDVYSPGYGLSPSRLHKVIMRVKADKLMYIRLDFPTNFNQNTSGGYSLDTKYFYIPGDGEWHDVEVECSKNDVGEKDQLGQICMTPQALAAEENTYDGTEVTADGFYYIKTVEYYGNALLKREFKYDFEEPVVLRNENECTARIPSFINYSSENINLGLVVTSYENGKLTDINYSNSIVDAGRTVSALEAKINSVSENSEVKLFVWDMNKLQPIKATDTYSDVIPDYSNGVTGDDDEIVVEPDDTDFEGKTKVLILGNSYTYHAPGNIYTNGMYVKWRGKWGMAASTQANDYAHLLKSYAKAKNENVAFMIKNIYGFESNPAGYKNELSALSEAAALNADVIILAIGTNMSKDLEYVEEAYKALIDYVDADHNAQIICAMLLGTGDSPKLSMFNAASDRNCSWIDLTDKNTGEYLAVEKYGENGVGWHYGDNGMKMVADNIWNGREYIADYISANAEDTSKVAFTGLKDMIPEASGN